MMKYRIEAQKSDLYNISRPCKNIELSINVLINAV
jgi:hypothetical protein